MFSLSNSLTGVGGSIVSFTIGLTATTNVKFKMTAIVGGSAILLSLCYQLIKSIFMGRSKKEEMYSKEYYIFQMKQNCSNHCSDTYLFPFCFIKYSPYQKLFQMKVADLDDIYNLYPIKIHVQSAIP
jgi:hypothetical protein